MTNVTCDRCNGSAVSRFSPAKVQEGHPLQAYSPPQGPIFDLCEECILALLSFLLSVKDLQEMPK